MNPIVFTRKEYGTILSSGGELMFSKNTITVPITDGKKVIGLSTHKSLIDVL
ncbi:MAG: hypothetical protein LBU24_03525 [Methanocalculaceae archaeon]|jgi:hypothetical protein|nr:hypothetical protein [Methanocalculaceae archaeon]